MKALALALAFVAAGTVATAAAEYTVVLDKMKFGPVPAEVHPGDTIVWQNNHILRHSATSTCRPKHRCRWSSAPPERWRSIASSTRA
jgi:plastocyanin